MKLWFRNFRISILNWLAASKITIEKDKPPVAYTLNTGPYNNGSGLHHSFSNHQHTQAQHMNIGNPTINFNVVKASGGWIVQVNPQQSYNTLSIGGVDVKPADLYLIHDEEDFDAALGKIVTASCLKA